MKTAVYRPENPKLAKLLECTLVPITPNEKTVRQSSVPLDTTLRYIIQFGGPSACMMLWASNKSELSQIDAELTDGRLIIRTVERENTCTC